MNVIEQYIRDVLEGGQRKKGTILSALDTFKKFNAWREESGLPITYISRTCAMSIGENYPVARLKEIMQL